MSGCYFVVLWIPDDREERQPGRYASFVPSTARHGSSFPSFAIQANNSGQCTYATGLGRYKGICQRFTKTSKRPATTAMPPCHGPMATKCRDQSSFFSVTNSPIKTPRHALFNQMRAPPNWIGLARGCLDQASAGPPLSTRSIFSPSLVQ
jgi:hypothetical protein